MAAAPGTAIAKLADGQDLVFPKPILDLADTVAADIHGEYLTDNMGGFRIGQKVVLILRGDDVPIGHFTVDALAPLGFCLLDRTDLLGGVARVKLIEHTSFGKVKRKQQKSSIHAGLRRDGTRSDTSLSDGQGAAITIA